MIEGALLSAKCPINVVPCYFLESFEAEFDWASLCQWHQRKDSCIQGKFGLDNPHGSFQLGEFMNCFSSSLPVKVVSILKELIRKGFFLTEWMRGRCINKEIKSSNQWGRLALSTCIIVPILVEAAVHYCRRPFSFALQPVPLESMQFHFYMKV